MDACLSFTTVSIFTDTDTYTDHGLGSQFMNLWMASFIYYCIIMIMILLLENPSHALL